MGCYHIRYAIAIDQSTIYNNVSYGNYKWNTATDNL